MASEMKRHYRWQVNKSALAFWLGDQFVVDMIAAYYSRLDKTYCLFILIVTDLFYRYPQTLSCKSKVMEADFGIPFDGRC